MIAFRAEDPEFMGEWYGRQEVYGLPLLTVDEFMMHISAVTKADIARVTRKYIVENTLNLAVVWNRPEDESILPLLRLA